MALGILLESNLSFILEEGEKTYFASEKKSILLALPNDELDDDALQHYLTYQFVPEPYTFIEWH